MSDEARRRSPTGHGGLTFARSERSQGPTLVIDGEIDLAVKGELDAQLAALVAVAHGSTLVDLSGVTFMDSTGTHALLETAAAARAAGAPLVLVAVSAPCRRVLELSGVWDALREPASGSV